MRYRHSLALGVVLWVLGPGGLAQAQMLVPGGPQLTPANPALPAGLLPLFQPQRLPTDTTPARPAADIAYGAYQRGYYLTALQEATKRLDKNKDDTAAMTLVGEIYKDGFSVRRSLTEAARWYKLAADRGDRQGAFALAIAALQGEGVPQDKALAKSLLVKAAAAGHGGALYNLGIIAIDAEIQDFQGAAAYFRASAEAGNADGAYSLAILYREGQGVPRDMTQAALWMKRAADEHIAAAEVEYGIMLFNGEGQAKDEAAAARYFLRAATRNNPVAMNRMARLYAAGRGVPKNIIESMKWHILARTVGLRMTGSTAR